MVACHCWVLNKGWLLAFHCVTLASIVTPHLLLWSLEADIMAHSGTSHLPAGHALG
jgi:hypothetical protein